MQPFETLLSASADAHGEEFQEIIKDKGNFYPDDVWESLPDSFRGVGFWKQYIG